MNNQEFKDNLISVLKSEGLILIPESVGVYAVKYFEKKRQLLTRVMVTPYQVVTNRRNLCYRWKMLCIN